jgi:putative endonuclease
VAFFIQKNEAMYYVYAIKSLIRNWIYVGMTSNIDRRLKQHNSGHNKSTKPYAPFKLVYSETQPDREHARKREKYLKTASGKRWLKYQINDV